MMQRTEGSAPMAACSRTEKRGVLWANAWFVVTLALFACSEEAPLFDAPADDATRDDTADESVHPEPDAGEARAEAGVTDAGAADGGGPGALDSGTADDFDIEDCNALCDSLGVLGCEGPGFECLQDCAVSVVAFMGTRCKELYVEMIECGQQDLLARFECDGEGVPALRADVCAQQQAALIQCVQSGG